MTTMRDFPIFDMATETMTLRLQCWRSRISLVDETSRFFLACAYTRSFCVFTGVATVNVFPSVNCFTLYQENCHCAVYFGPPCTAMQPTVTSLRRGCPQSMLHYFGPTLTPLSLSHISRPPIKYVTHLGPPNF